MKSTIKSYAESRITFDTLIYNEVMVNVTEVAKHFGKEPYDFLRLPSTLEFINALIEDADKGFDESFKVGFSHLETADHEDLGPGLSRSQNPKFTKEDFVRTVQTGRNNGTWMHRHLAVKFAAWLDVKFELWMIRTIDEILTGQASDRQRKLKEKATRLLRLEELENLLADNEHFQEYKKLEAAVRADSYQLSKLDSFQLDLFKTRNP